MNVLSNCVPWFKPYKNGRWRVYPVHLGLWTKIINSSFLDRIRTWPPRGRIFNRRRSRDHIFGPEVSPEEFCVWVPKALDQTPRKLWWRRVSRLTVRSPGRRREQACIDDYYNLNTLSYLIFAFPTLSSSISLRPTSRQTLDHAAQRTELNYLQKTSNSYCRSTWYLFWGHNRAESRGTTSLGQVAAMNAGDHLVIAVVSPIFLAFMELIALIECM